jgi:hypothetical protein
MPYADEAELVKIYENAEGYFKPYKQNVPGYMEGETPAGYRRRLATNLQQHTPSLKNINLRESVGSAFNLIEKQIYDEAQREAIRPTTIPKGEMRELTKYDATGRPFIEFHGHPSAWMDDFTNGAKRRLIGIRTETQRGYIPNN